MQTNGTTPTGKATARPIRNRGKVKSLHARWYEINFDNQSVNIRLNFRNGTIEQGNRGGDTERLRAAGLATRTHLGDYIINTGIRGLPVIE